MASTDATKTLSATLGGNIRRAREDAGLTQREVALQLNWRKTDSQAVSDWERGVRRPSDEALILLCRLFGHDIGWFYTQHERQAA